MEKRGQDWIGAAISAMRAGGVENVKVEALARTLGVTKGSFYWHFRDRGELLEAIIRAWEEETEWLIARAQEVDQPRARLVRYFTLVPETSKTYPPDVEMLAWARRDARVNRRVRAIEARRIAFFEGELKRAGFRGRHAALRARMAFLASQGWIEQLSRGAHGGESFESFATHLFDMVLSKPARKGVTA